MLSGFKSVQYMCSVEMCMHCSIHSTFVGVMKEQWIIIAHMEANEDPMAQSTECKCAKPLIMTQAPYLD